MTPDRWTRLSDWHNAWLAADAAERGRLRDELSASDPALLAEADGLTAVSAALSGFLETPAFVLAAPELTRGDPLLVANTMVGPYRIVAVLARGGMGDVYHATDVRLRRDVALKVLSPDRTGDTRPVERFVQEARLTASLDHPNIVRLYDIGLVDGRPYFVGELLAGDTLRTSIGRGALPVRDVLQIGASVARGLVAAHAAGFVHRDLKPENIFLTRSGTTKILDFGIATLAHGDAVREGRSTLTGNLLGTAGYLAPEQIRGHAVDGRADLFTLGAILFEMLTGRRAFAREHTVDTLHAILHEPPEGALEERHDVPLALSALVRRLLEKSPDARPQSAGEVAAALEEIASGSAAPGRPSSHGAASWRSTGRVRLAVPVAALAVVLALAVGWLYRRGTAPVPVPHASTLAVLPFRSLPARADNELLELGLADVFISRLNQLPDVRVLPLSATEALRGADPRDAGLTLGVDRVLTGTVQREETGVRASVQLLSISEDRVIWSTTFDAHAAGAFSIQDAVVSRVLQEIAPQLSPDTRDRLVAAGTRNSDAFESYLRGRAHAAHATGADFSRAVDSFRHAVTLDPTYADAWAALGASYVRLPLVGGMHPVGPFGEATRAAMRALELAPDHAGAQWVLGTVAFWYEWDYARAETLLRGASTRQPGAAEPLVYLAHLLSNLGRHDEALVEIARARERDPGLPIARSLQGQFLFMARRYDEALAHMDAMVRFAPTFVQGHVMRAYPLVSLRRYAEAIRACGLALELEASIPRSGTVRPKVFPRALQAFASARAGRRAEAEAALDDIRRQERREYVPPTHIALVLHGLGRDDEALEQLRRAVDVRDPALTFLGVDPKWDELRERPSFQALLSRVNLLEVSTGVLGRR